MLESPFFFGYEFLKILESIRHPVLNYFFYILSFLGNTEFYTIFFPILFWVVSKKYGLRLLTIFLVSAYTNTLLKLFFAHPRPDANLIQVLFHESKGFADYGIPSGHSQNAMALWGLMFLYAKNKWLKAVALLLLLGIPFSRLYNANHFVADVWVGMSIGGLLLFIFYKWVFSKPDFSNEQTSLEGRFYRFIFQVNPHNQSIEIRIPSLLWINLILLLGLFYLYPEPNLARVLGVMMGAMLGYALLIMRGGFSLHGLIWHKIARVIVGISGIVAIQVGVKIILVAIFSENAVNSQHEFALLRYMLIALWAIWLAPESFILLRLAKRCAFVDIYDRHQERSK